jgi:hypothetical protein
MESYGEQTTGIPCWHQLSTGGESLQVVILKVLLELSLL